MAHGGGEWVVIYRNRDRRVKVGVTERERGNTHKKNMLSYKLNIHTFIESHTLSCVV